MKVALYARVSTDDKGQDPEVQMDILRSLAEARGYSVEREYIDFASGKDGNRPQFKELIRSASKHEIDAIMAVRLDRVMRSVVNLNTIVQQLSIYNVKLIFTDMEFDPSNPSSKLVFNFLSAIAEWERDIISKRTKEGLAHAKNKGVKLGRSRRTDIPVTQIAMMRIHGLGWRAISSELGIPKSTIIGRREDIESAILKIKGS